MIWLLLWPLSGLIIWSWFNYSAHVAKENSPRITIRGSLKAAGLLGSLLAGPITLVSAISVFLDNRDEENKISPKFGFKIW